MTDEPSKAAAVKDLPPLWSDPQPANTKSVQTEQSAALEVEIDEQKELNRQLMTRERDMKHHIQLLQQELDKRSSETVVMAANMREMKTQLSDSQPDEQTSESTSQPALEPYYIRENFNSHVSLDTVSSETGIKCFVKLFIRIGSLPMAYRWSFSAPRDRSSRPNMRPTFFPTDIFK